MIAAAPVAIDGASRSRLHLGRIELAVRAATRDADWPAQWADADLFRREAGAAIEEALAPLLDDADPSVWVIHRLDLANLIDGDRERVAHGFAAALRDAIARALRGEDGGTIIRFPSRSAYLARLLAEVARGDGFERWYHFRYRHLRALPTRDALIHIVGGDPEASVQALAELHAGRQLGELVEALGEPGARRVLDLLAGRGQASSPSSPAHRIAASEAVRAIIARWGSGACGQLVLLSGAIRPSGLSAPVLVAAARALIRAEAAHWPRARLQGGAFAEPLHKGSDPDVGRDPRRRSHDRSAPSPEPGHVLHRTSEGTAENIAIDTPFAGIFLLWRSVVELGLERLVPPGQDGARARLTLAATLAGREWRVAFEDPALRWLAGIDDPEAKPARAALRLATAFARHMAEHAAPRPLQLVEQRHGAIRVFQDAVSEDWIHLAGPGGSARSALPHAVPPADARARPVSRDLDYFGVDARTAASRLSWVLLARAAFADFGRRLTGLERSSAAWLAANLIAGEGRVAFGDVPEILLPGVPLDLVLRMTGIDGTVVAPAEGPAFRLRLPEPG